MQFLHLHPEYFRITNDYNRITVFIQNTLRCMFSAIIELNKEVQKKEEYYKDFMKSRIQKFHYGSYFIKKN